MPGICLYLIFSCSCHYVSIHLYSPFLCYFHVFCSLQSTFEDAKSEIKKWHSSFQNESFIPLGVTPGLIIRLHFLQLFDLQQIKAVMNHDILAYFCLICGNLHIYLSEPRFIVNYLQSLRSSEESLREQVRFDFLFCWIKLFIWWSIYFDPPISF